tara:strand:- start:23 stop:841 length:819 start_codon:yes stop_codon:yes gene_type:complete
MKHNYTLAKERELKLVECLNNNLDDTKFNQIANYINNELGYNFDSFSHSGSIQTEPGDILGYVGDEIVPIELKILQKTKTTKSHGGVSGDFWKIVNPNNTGYIEYEKSSGVEQQRWDLVSQEFGVNINSHKDYIQYEKQVKSSPELKEKLVKLTNEYKIKYLDILVEELTHSNQEILINIINSLTLGYRKFPDVVKKHTNKKLVEIQVGKFSSDNIVLSTKTYTPNNTEILSISRNGYGFKIVLDKIQISFPLVHGNGYQGSGRTRTFKCMY